MENKNRFLIGDAVATMPNLPVLKNYRKQNPEPKDWVGVIIRTHDSGTSYSVKLPKRKSIVRIYIDFLYRVQ